MFFCYLCLNKQKKLKGLDMKIPPEISRPTKYLLDRGVLITATLTSDRCSLFHYINVD